MRSKPIPRRTHHTDSAPARPAQRWRKVPRCRSGSPPACPCPKTLITNGSTVTSPFALQPLTAEQITTVRVAHRQRSAFLPVPVRNQPLKSAHQTWLFPWHLLNGPPVGHRVVPPPAAEHSSRADAKSHSACFPPDSAPRPLTPRACAATWARPRAVCGLLAPEFDVDLRRDRVGMVLRRAGLVLESFHPACS